MIAEALHDLWRALVFAGFTCVALTTAYELTLGRIAIRLSSAETASDFDLSPGRLLPIGLLFLMFAPLLAARLRGRLCDPTCKERGPHCEQRHKRQ